MNVNFNRIRISKDATNKARNTAGRIKITPNIIYRFGLCLSISEPDIPNPKQYDEEGQELNRYTLFGEYDLFFVSLLKERLVEDGLDPEKDFYEYLRAHINRGTMYFCSRVRDLADIYELIDRKED